MWHMNVILAIFPIILVVYALELIFWALGRSRKQVEKETQYKSLNTIAERKTGSCVLMLLSSMHYRTIGGNIPIQRTNSKKSRFVVVGGKTAAFNLALKIPQNYRSNLCRIRWILCGFCITSRLLKIVRRSEEHNVTVILHYYKNNDKNFLSLHLQIRNLKCRRTAMINFHVSPLDSSESKFYAE